MPYEQFEFGSQQIASCPPGKNMLLPRLRELLILTVWQVFSASGQNSTCTLDGRPNQNPPSSLLPSNTTSITLWMEISLLYVKETYVVKEVYNRVQNVSMLEYYDDRTHSIERLLVSRKKKQPFILSYGRTECAGALLNDTTAVRDIYARIPFAEWLNLDTMPATPDFIGPASKLEDFVARRNQRQSVISNEVCSFDRSLPCDLYQECDSFNKLISYFVSRPGYEMFGQTRSLPLRMTLGDSLTVELLHVQLSNDSDVNGLFAPTGISCNISHGWLSVPMPDQLEFDAEMTLTGQHTNGTLISSLSGLYTSLNEENPFSVNRRTPRLYAFSYDTWQLDTDQTRLNKTPRQRIIFDDDHKILYVHSYAAELNAESAAAATCEKMAKAPDFRPRLSLPMYGELDLETLLLDPPTSDTPDVSLTYLGDNKALGVASTVYEATYIDYLYGTIKVPKLIVSYHIDELTQAPLAIEIRGIAGQEIVFTATLHIAKRDLAVVDLHKKLRVDDCYDGWDQSAFHWLQLGFSLAERGQLPQIASAQRALRENILMEFCNHFHVLPMRFPEVTIDVLEEEILVNILLLERAVVEDEFDAFNGFDIREPSQHLGVLSKSACLAACLSQRIRSCTGVSYCGSTCAVTNATVATAAQNVQTDTDCVLFSRHWSHTIPTSAELLAELQDAVDSDNADEKFAVKVDVSNPDGPADQGRVAYLVANSLRSVASFEGAFHEDDEHAHVLESVFRVAASRRQFVVGDDIRKIGSIAMEDCAVACRNRDDCEAFSYCKSTRECIISAKHDIEINKTTHNNHCVIYQASYVDRFLRFPGLVMKGSGRYQDDAASVEACAQRCFTDTTCKSFDYCELSATCYLQSTHVHDAPGNTETLPECAHYSKQYLSDYSRKPGRQGSDSGAIVAVFGNYSSVDCAQRCSEWSNPDKPCLSFDYCNVTSFGSGVCTLRTEGAGMRFEPSCTLYEFMAGGRGSSRHGSAAVASLSLLLMCIGAALGIAGVVAYQRFR